MKENGEAMGHWGVKSYENDEADFAIDAGLAQVHGAVYEDLMEDGNPTPFDEVQKKLANPETLAAAVAALRESFGPALSFEEWDDEQRLALAGVVVRHAEFNVAIPEDLRIRAVAWLHDESIEWDEATKRSLRRQKEIQLLMSLMT